MNNERLVTNIILSNQKAEALDMLVIHLAKEVDRLFRVIQIQTNENIKIKAVIKKKFPELME
ncbi:MAG: hypothetical protein COB83_09750 [Gammaproteobacteria bacterium]|nr:MAG: hypothetical protein COB83_09750 [Gammaproteobacteria bacterium]